MYDVTPGVPIINHDAPKHRCPICHHVCFTRQRSKSNRIGRPPTFRTHLLQVLRDHTRPDRALTADELSARLGVKKISLPALICRARKSGLDIRNHERRGYYLHTPE